MKCGLDLPSGPKASGDILEPGKAAVSPRLFFILNPVLGEIPMLQSGVQSQTSGSRSCAHQVYKCEQWHRWLSNVDRRNLDNRVRGRGPLFLPFAIVASIN
jgi:hypothetical protein